MTNHDDTELAGRVALITGAAKGLGAQMARRFAAAGARVVVAGHSHQPRLEEREGVLFLNPGSAGPRRFRLPVSLGELRIEGGEVQARLLTLQEGSWR